MNVTGIIMECNPFHEGHSYLLREARLRTGADYIVVAMSGDFVQRGEPAVYDKYFRAERILHAGADLVLELPLYAACGSAEYFARGGIALLKRLGVVTDLCFGSESGDISAILKYAEYACLLDSAAPSDESEAVLAGLRDKLRAGMSFPAARAAAIPGYPETPNDLLAVEYCRALLRSGTESASKGSIVPHALPRIDVPSATTRRKELLLERDSLREPGPVPDTETPASQLSPAYPLGPDDFSGPLLYTLRMQQDHLERYADVTPDLADRIRRLLPAFDTYTGFCGLLKTRNLTYTRISRCLLHILLGMDQTRLDDLQSSGMALYARPLAMNRSAGPLLSSIHGNSSIPFLSKMSAARSLLTPAAYGFLEEECRAEELYSLMLRQALLHSSRCRDDSLLSSFRPLRAAQRRIVVLDRPQRS